MTNRIKLILGAAGAGILIITAVIIIVFCGRSGILGALPAPEGTRPYVLIETKDKNYPKAVSALLTDGLYALLRNGTPRNALLKTAAAAQEAGVLVEDRGEAGAEVYCVFLFDDDTAAALKKGALPQSLSTVFKNGEIREDAKIKNVSAIHAEDLATPVYYTAWKKYWLMAASPEALAKMTEATDDKKKSLASKKWTLENKWPAHIEFCDGGVLTTNSEYKFPISIEAAWHASESAKAGEPAGEARWALVNLDKKVELYLNSSLKARKWKTSSCVIPEPLLLSVGVNLPPLSGSPKEWPFPLSAFGETADSLGLSESKVREILSGQTVFSLGGQNRILWFSLPGFLVEFTGKPAVMTELIQAFWENLFFGAIPKPLPGFTAGGTTNVPFSVVGAGRDDIAILGLVSAASLNNKDGLGSFLKEDEEVVGWMLADLPRIGGALSEMTKMSSFIDQEAGEDDPALSEEQSTEAATEAEPLQPEMALTPFDQGITDSFGNVLKGMGRILVVWEKPLSGRINWYNNPIK